MKWQPIETAPRDGTKILCWSNKTTSISQEKAKPYIAWWGVDWNSFSKKPENAEWLTGDGDDFSTGHYFTPCEPTHWMLLPSPPKD